MIKKQQEAKVPLVPQINIESLRIKKLISLFEPLYMSSKDSRYYEYIESLKNELDNNKDVKIIEDIKNGKNRQFDRK
jgi:hypothetical protein